MIEINNVLNRLNQLKGQKELLRKQLTAAQKNKEDRRLRQEQLLKAREIFTIVAENTQKTIEYEISNLVGYAIASVFPNPWQFKLAFVQRRNKTEADLIFYKENEEKSTTDILNAGGGGVADIAASALRFAMWSLQRTKPVFFLDEPTRFLHNLKYQEKASDMLNEISHKMNTQIIVITDQDALIGAADNNIRVINKNGISTIVKEEK